MMNKREKFDLALEMFADIDAVRDGRDMEKIKEFLFDAFEDKTPCEATFETTDEYIYVVYMLYNGHASNMMYFTDNFESAKDYIYKIIKEEVDAGEDYRYQLDNISGLTFEEYKDNDYFHEIVLDDDLGFGFALGSEKKNTDIHNWDLD